MCFFIRAPGFIVPCGMKPCKLKRLPAPEEQLMKIVQGPPWLGKNFQMWR